MTDFTVPRGAPGIPPRWTSSDKDGVGTALSALSRVWFTISHGILNEVYYPRVDQACIRDLGLVVNNFSFADHVQVNLSSNLHSFEFNFPCCTCCCATRPRH